MTRLMHVLLRPLFFLRKKLSSRQFFIASSIVVGLTSGLAAVALKFTVHFISNYVHRYSTNYTELMLFALFPMVGLLLTVVIMHLIHERPKKGSAEIAYAIVKKSSVIPSGETYSHLS